MDLESTLNMSPLTAWVYLVLSTGSITPKILAASAGVSTRTIRRAINQLRDLGIEVQRNGQKATAQSDITQDVKPDIKKAPKKANPINNNNNGKLEPGHDSGQDSDSLPAVIPADMLLSIPTRPGLDELLSDPAQELETPSESGAPPYNRGIPRRFCKPEEAPDPGG